MKQTAVEQLQEYLTISLGPDRMRMLFNEFEKAKELEKQQIMDAYNMGDRNGAIRISYCSGKYDITAEDYVNVTFKSL